jgi:hypothetical protein
MGGLSSGVPFCVKIETIFYWMWKRGSFENVEAVLKEGFHCSTKTAGHPFPRIHAGKALVTTQYTILWEWKNYYDKSHGDKKFFNSWGKNERIVK